MEDPVSLGLMAATTVLNMSSASSAAEAAYADAARLERMATARYAKGTREAGEEKRQGDIVLSNARAAMAAGGGTTTDPAAIEAQGKIASEGEYNSLMAMYEGKLESEDMRDQAASIRKAAKDKAKHAKIASVLKFASGMFSPSGGDYRTSPRTLTRRTY